MLSILGAIVLIGAVILFAFAGVAGATIAAVLVACAVIGVLCMVFGMALVFAIKVALAVVLALLLQFLFCRALTWLGGRLSITARMEHRFTNNVAWILSGVVTGYLYCIR